LNTGCLLLRELLQWAATKTTDAALITQAALAAYNGGRGGNDPSKDKPLRRASYAREVLARYPILKKEFANGAV
jgi:hypothetical protein